MELDTPSKRSYSCFQKYPHNGKFQLTEPFQTVFFPRLQNSEPLIWKFAIFASDCWPSFRHEKRVPSDFTSSTESIMEKHHQMELLADSEHVEGTIGSG